MMANGTFRVLVVEDDWGQAALTMRLLQRVRGQQYEVRIANTLTQAIEWLNAQSYHAVLLDLGLPECQGLETLRRIREHDANTPVIVLTAWDDDQTAMQSLEHGAQDYVIKKSLDADTLGRCIRYARQRQCLLTELQHANRRNEHLLHSIPCLLMGFDENRRITQWNQAAVDLLGVRDELAIGRRLAELDLPLNYDAIERLIDESRVSAARIHGEDLPFRRRDGVEGCLELHLATLRDGNQFGTEVLLLGTDVTERRRLKHRMSQAQRLENLGQLVAGVAHEFNNILQAIKGYSSLVLKDLPVGSQSADDLSQVLSAADRATLVTGQLLRFGRRDVGSRCPIDINTTIEALAKMLRPVVGPSIHLDLQFDSDLTTILADSGMIEQVVMNLCLNARDAMPDGGRLTISTRRFEISPGTPGEFGDLRPGAYARLTIEDTGCGIPSELQRRVFEPFFTTKEIGKGTGLGLAVIFGLVQHHHGLITLESEPGCGAKFHVYLPLDQPSNIAWPTSHTTQHREMLGTTVLLVEDDDLARGVAVRILSNAGYSVLVACGRDEAVDLFQEHRARVGVVLIACAPPETTSAEVFEALYECDPTVRVLFCVNSADDSFDASCAALEGLPIIEKPFDPDTLPAAIRAAMASERSIPSLLRA